MKLIYAAAMTALCLAMAGGPVLAATDVESAMGDKMSKPAMATDNMAMSKSDMKAAEACKKMTAEKMAKSAKCQKMARMHPEAMMASPMGAMSTGAMGKTAH